MRIKHLLPLKQKHKNPPWKNIATYWLATDLYNYSEDYHFLMDNSRTKRINNRKQYHYQDIIYYIKHENNDIKKIENPNTKNIYQKVIHEGSKQHKIAGETYGKNSCQNWTSNKYGKTYISHAQPFYTNLHYSLPHYSTKTKKYMHKCTKDINPKCNYCQNVENKLHLFTECPRIDKISAYYQLQLTKLTGQKYSP